MGWVSVWVSLELTTRDVFLVADMMLVEVEFEKLEGSQRCE